MIKTKTLMGLLVAIWASAFSAAPAFAEFASNTGATHGGMSVGTLTILGGGSTLECSGAEAEWKIQTAGKIEEHEKGGKQEPATKGPQLYAAIRKWKVCTVTTSMVKKLNAEMSECVWHWDQASGVLTAKFAVISLCTIRVKVLGITCEVKIPAAKETEKMNFELETNALENSGNNLLITAEDTGITTKPGSGCVGVSETKEAKLKSTKGGISAEGIKEI